MLIKFAWVYAFLIVLAGCAAVPPQSASPPEALAQSPLTPDNVVEIKSPPPAPSAVKPPPPVSAQVPVQILKEKPMDVWARIRAGFSMADSNDPAIQEGEAWYASRPDYMQRIFSRGQRYLFHIVEEVEKRGMPTEIALLPVVESAFNPKAYSRSHASGIWQFIPSTGKYFGLQQNWWYDGRRDVLSSTNAALDYLQKLYNRFGSWDLALSAYNFGEGNLSRAIAQNFAAGLPTDLQSLNLPNETRNYVPRLLAVKRIVRHPENYGLTLNTIANQPYFTTIQISHHLDVDLAAKFAEMSLDDFIALNPAYNKPVITRDAEKILLPVDKAQVFAQNLSNYKKSLVSWQAYTAKRGEKISKIAKKFNMALARFKEINRGSDKKKAAGGEMFLVPLASSGSAAVTLPSEPLPEKIVQASSASSYTIKKGDTLYSVAKRYGVSASHLMAANDLKSPQVISGQVIRVTGSRQSKAGNISRTNKHYTVKRGDTLSSIARHFKVAVEDLRRWNQLSTKEALLPGAKVVIF